MIPFNKPFLAGNELAYIRQAVEAGKISGNGIFTQKCHHFFEQKFNFPKVLLTNSCTDALEMAAILANIQPGDEVIVPSFTFVSTANAFVLRGAKIVFADSNHDEPNIDITKIENLITPNTKAIAVLHYGGVACDMDALMSMAATYSNRYGHKIFVVEDAAHAVGASYNGRPLGSIGDMAAFSFHETKNISAGEGGMLVINDQSLVKRAEVIWEKGTNRVAFSRKEIESYDWIDIGSSFLPSEVTAAFLYAQLEKLDMISSQRMNLWNRYVELFSPAIGEYALGLPVIPPYASPIGHIFYLLCRSSEERTALIRWLESRGITAVFHYQSLHRSAYYAGRHDGRNLVNSDRFSDLLLRLPLYHELGEEAITKIFGEVCSFYKNSRS